MDESIRALARELTEHGAARLQARDRRVLARIAGRRQAEHEVDPLLDGPTTLGERAADGLARWGGSWAFVGGFAALLVLWTGWNLLGPDRFDPYPFIFLNLILSMLAAIQAPVIMMSQNRTSEHDRRQAANDYEVNLRAEIEIMELHAKLDLLAERVAGRPGPLAQIPPD